jgi:hypothetical protein
VSWAAADLLSGLPRGCVRAVFRDYECHGARLRTDMVLHAKDMEKSSRASFCSAHSWIFTVAQKLRAEGSQKEARGERQVAIRIDHAPASYEDTVSKLLTWKLLKTPISLRHGSIAVSGCAKRTREMLLFKHVQYMPVNIDENDYSQGTNDIGC